MFDLIISIIVLAAVALTVGGFVLWRKGFTRKAMLMGLLAFIMLANVAVWLVPMEDGNTPMEAASNAVADEEAGR